MTTHQETHKTRAAWLHLDSWAGRSRHRVTVVSETPKRYHVLWDDDPALRRFFRGEFYTVPKYSVTFEQSENQ